MMPEQLSCVDCSAGRASSSSALATACDTCEGGRYQPLTGATTCNVCIPGQYEQDQGQTQCKLCPLNSFTNAARQIQCKTCHDGTYTSNPGAAACIKCGAGRFGVGCVACPHGWYRHEKMSVSACVLCGIGRTTAVPGATSCDGCDAGTYGSRPGLCVDCPSGFYQESKANTECVQCAVASLFVNVRTECFGCDLGRYGSSTAPPGVCERCPSGKYQDAKGSLQCKSCPQDRYYSDDGATALSQCKVCANDRTTGSVVGSTSSKACVCKKSAYYQDEDGSEDCQPCIIGAVCPFDGTTLKDIYAKPGYWLPENVTREVVDCGEAFADIKLKELARKRCCPPETTNCSGTRDANWTSNEQCETGFAGPLCVACATDYVLYEGGCIRCDGGSPLWFGVVSLSGVAFVLFLVALFILKRTVKVQEHVDESYMTRIAGMVSIIISWLQILSALTVTCESFRNGLIPPDFCLSCLSCFFFLVLVLVFFELFFAALSKQTTIDVVLC